MNTQEKRILIFASLAHFFTHFYILVFPALVMPMSRSLNLPLSEVLGYSFWMALLFGLLAVPWGIAGDKWNAKYVMSSGIILAGLGMVFAGLAGGRGALIFSFALVGVGCGAFHPAGTALVSQGIRERGKALGINGVWGTAGMAAAPFIMGFLQYVFHWQRSLLYIGIAGLFFGVLSLVVPFSYEKGVDVKKTNALKSGSAVKLFVLFILIMIAAGFQFQSFSLILPSFLEFKIGAEFSGVGEFFTRLIPGFGSDESLQTLTAGIVTTGVYLFGIFGQYVGGKAADRYSLKWSYFVFFCSALPFVPLMYLLKAPLVIPAAGMFLFFTLGMQPIENSLIAYLTPSGLRSVSYGIKFTLTFGIGSLAVKMTSFTEGRWGIPGVIVMVGIFLLLVIGGIMVFLVAARHEPLRH
ncbi:MAG: MFS transporter [Spirochaetales bacterium]|nr:MFS transporter [Spirochaetales bacterium]